MFFTMVLIKKNKNRKLGSKKIKKNIAFILLDEFFNCFSYAKKDAIQSTFRINDFISKAIREKQI